MAFTPGPGNVGYSLRERRQGGWMALPAALWLLIFFLLPLVIVLFVSFLTRDARGSVTFPLTLQHYERIFGPFFRVILDSVRIAIVTTLICLLVGYPLAFFISTRK